jgi:hypothetical protein
MRGRRALRGGCALGRELLFGAEQGSESSSGSADRRMLNAIRQFSRSDFPNA